MRFSWLVLLLLVVLLVGPVTPSAQATTPFAQAGPYVVQPGDTVNGLLLRFCMSWQELYALNPHILTPNPAVLRWGTTLQVVNRCAGSASPSPLPGGGCVAACLQSCPQGPMLHAMGALNGSVYTVAVGDTLYSIARRFCTTVDALAHSNGITNPRHIAVGQCLAVPVNTIAPKPTPTPGGPTLAATPTPAPLTPTATPTAVAATFTPTPTPVAVSTSIMIDIPAANALLGRSVIVTGRAVGVQSGWIVVQAVDSSGTQALGQSFAPVVGGAWATVLVVTAPAGSTGSIFAYWNQNTTVSARLPVRYGG